MDRMLDLVEQHILESASRLRHIDELMAKARTPTKPATGAETAALLKQIEADRDKLAQLLEELRRLLRSESPEAVKRGEGLKGLMESVGLQLEKVLATIFEEPTGREAPPRQLR